ncbi:MAG: MBL fold metallo-hydrolase RNA specificity domain-containing protein [Symbiobacteriia bacterium]
MRLTFGGGAGSVTGSCYLIETRAARFLVDCGMFQGSQELEAQNYTFPFNPAAIEHVILTHAHIDHSGRIPRLHRDGFAGTVWATPATADLAGIMLPDSGHIQELEAGWHNRKRQRAGQENMEPLYTADDAQRTLPLFKPLPYDQVAEVAPGVRLRFRDAGHILGSAIAEVWIKENGREIKFVFSGDLGSPNRPILRDPTLVAEADILFIESTYGDRLHGDHEGQVGELAEIVRSVAQRGGNLVIPSFAVGRTQEVLYHLNQLLEAGRIPALPVYVDSPLATSATAIFRRHQECFDKEAARLLATGDDPFSFEGLSFVRTPQDSMALNQMSGAIIISANGMASAGRILHHLKHNLWRPESTVLFVGYQAEGTLGRVLLSGTKHVHVLGEALSVRAEIRQLSGFSAHADKDGLLSWAHGFTHPPAATFVVHGEQAGLAAMAASLHELGHETRVPALGQAFEIKADAQGYVTVAETEASPLAHAEPVTGRQWNGLEREANSALQGLRRFRQALLTGQYDGLHGGLAQSELWKELHRALKDVGLSMTRWERRVRRVEEH